MNSEPWILKVGEEPPPLHRAEPLNAGTAPGYRRGEGQTGSCSTGDRIAVLNAFVDFTM